MTTPRWKGLAALLLAVTMIAAACGGRDDDNGAAGNGDDGNGDDTTEASTELVSADDCDDYDGTQGVTDDSILIGNSLPQSGQYSIFDQVRIGIEAYFSYVNDNGGVEGRNLELVSLDDQYLAERTRSNVEELVNSEGVFALLGMVGTENNEAAQQFLEEQGLCVPNLSVATGFPGFGDPERDPWIINGLPNYALEAVAFAEYLKENDPDATVSVLAQNDAFGSSYVDAFEDAIEGTDITITERQTFDAAAEDTAQGQVTTLASDGADALLLAVTGLPCPNVLSSISESGWDPLTYVTLTCSSKILMTIAGDAAEGTLSTRATYDPGDPANAEEPAVVEFREQGAAAGLTDEEMDELNVAAGWGFGAYLVQLLEASEELDRATVMNTAWFQSGVEFGLNLDGLEWTTDGASDPFGIDQLQFIRRTDGNWVPEGELVDYGDQLAGADED